MYSGVSTLIKNTTPSFSPSPLLNLQTVQAPLFRQSPYILFFCEPPKIRFFSELLLYQHFSSLTPSHLLKVTKFLVKIFQFKFLDTTKKIFLFLNFFGH